MGQREDRLALAMGIRLRLMADSNQPSSAFRLLGWNIIQSPSGRSFIDESTQTLHKSYSDPTPDWNLANALGAILIEDNSPGLDPHEISVAGRWFALGLMISSDMLKGLPDIGDKSVYSIAQSWKVPVKLVHHLVVEDGQIEIIVEEIERFQKAAIGKEKSIDILLSMMIPSHSTDGQGKLDRRPVKQPAVSSGGVLPDYQIRQAVRSGDIGVDPFDDALVTPASLDLCLGDEVVHFPDNDPLPPVLDPGSVEEILDRGEPIKISESYPYLLRPNDFILIRARENVRLGPQICGWLAGRSRWAMVGLNVSASAAGFFQPGWGGRPILEVTTHHRGGVHLVPNAPVAQLVFQWMAAAPSRPYINRGVSSV